jgi:predicted nucleic acid-binding Zn ribbon protein
MKDKPLTVCPKEKCKLKKWGKGRVKKLMSTGAGLLFKGSGFYITDYRSENYKQGAKKESSAGESKGADAKTSGGESKAAPAKSESKPAAAAKPAKAKD